MTAYIPIDFIHAIYRQRVGAQFTVCPLGIAPAVPLAQIPEATFVPVSP